MTSPFPALHTQANEDATARAEAARSRTELAGEFLVELDALLGDAA
jgi:hypothetical protein